MNVNEEIRQKIADVAANKLSVWAFEQWLEPRSWSMHRDLSPQDRTLIGSIQSTFARFDFEDSDEAELRSALLALVQIPVRKLSIQFSSSVSASILVSLSINVDQGDANSHVEIKNSASAPNREWFVPALAEL